MDPSIWITAAVTAALVLPAGWWWGRRSAAAPKAAPAARPDDLAERLAAVEARAKRELAAAHAAAEARLAQAAAAHAGEVEQLKRHLLDAYDALDQQRRPASAPDTGHGFAPTLPMRDL